jgi:hypothetical protein
MKSLQSPSKRNRRCADVGAVLVVVLIVMVALLGLGMTGLFLTSSSIQMNTNINLRNQAIVVAEAGLERARGMLNDRNATPLLPALLAGSNPGAGDDVPTSTTACDGIAARGAILVDNFSPGCTAGPAFCKLQNVDYPNLANRGSDLPAASGAAALQTMGQYTVYIRQDQADCRMGNFTCDNAQSFVDGGVPAVPCVPPAGAPSPPNGAVVVRSEGVASDGRTRVVLEVTMTPSSSAAATQNPTISALCSAGANGCDDNSSVQSGIVVNSGAPQTPPSTGGIGTGGATSAGGSGGTSSGTGTLPDGSGGTTTGGAAGSGTGGSGHGGSSGTGGTTGCGSLTCPRVAIMGLYGLEASTAFDAWLKTFSSGCYVQNLDTEHNTINDDLLAPKDVNGVRHPYNVIIVLDVDHLPKDYTDFAKEKPIDVYQAALAFCSPNPVNRKFSATEAAALKSWVQNDAGGLLVTQGYGDSLKIITNANTLVEPLGLAFYSPDCGFNYACPACPSCIQAQIWRQDAYGEYNVTTFASHPVTVGMSKLYASGYWPISGYSSGNLASLGSNYKVLATSGCLNCKTANLNLNFMVAGTVGAGRVLAVGDEWLTFDRNMADATNGPTAKAFWTNSIGWLSNYCQ